MQTQEKQILRDLKRGARITPLMALKLYGSFRLGARIWSLKQKGHKIRTKMVKVGGKSVAEYAYEASKR
jgi:hypothetical protein